MRTVLLIILCLFFPFIAVAIHQGLNKRVVIAIILQIIGHLPGVIYGLYVVTRDPAQLRR